MRTLGKVLLLLAGSVVAVVQLAVVVYAVTGVRDTVEVHRNADRARSEIAAALPAARQQAEDWQRRVATTGTPAYSWSELQCTFDSVDAGWIVQDYEQSCRLLSVAMWPSQEVPSTCVEAGDGVVAPTALLRADASWPCPHYLTSPPVYGAHRLVAGERPTHLSTAPAWRVAQSAAEVSRTTIGCDPWTIVFCTQPMDHPVL